MPDMTSSCARCPGHPVHSTMKGCKNCGEGMCPSCFAGHDCYGTDAAKTMAARVVTPCECKPEHDDWGDL